MKKKILIVVAVFLVAAAMPLHAQSGCGDSPEAPTAILALVGSVSAFVVALNERFKARK
jgi:XrtJ-associated TM-motif-TM protein